MFGHLLHRYLTADEYDQLPIYELEEMRSVCAEITKK